VRYLFALRLAPKAPTTPMSRTRPLRTLTLLALAASSVLVSCSSSGESQASSNTSSIAGIEREGAANETQLRMFLQDKAREWAWAGGQFDAPSDGATLGADMPQTFNWHADPADFAEGGANGDDTVMTHLLLFSTPSHAHLLEVFTTLRAYTPNVQDWQKLVDAREAISLSLTTATFVGADLPEAGGPYVGQTLTFTIE